MFLPPVPTPMCGRFTLRTPVARLVEQFQLSEAPAELPPRYNIAPSQPIAAVRQTGGGQRRLDLLRWGLVPAWANDPRIGDRMINARAETAAQRPAFRSAFRRRRCLIPADGYYEWRKTGGRKQPYLIHMEDDRPFAFAGLWERWSGDPEHEPLETCVILTTDANEVSRPIHDRMPVILAPEDYPAWLDPDVQDRKRLERLLRPFPSAGLRADPVSTLVNNPRNDDPRCVAVQRALF